MAGSLDAQIATLTASVAANKTAADSAITLINGFKQQLADAVAAAQAAGATDAQLQAILDLQATLDAETANLAAAVASNTPSPTPPQLRSVKPK